MAESTLNWPLEQRPDKDDTIILSSQGIRLWSAPCRIDFANGIFRLICSDSPTLENLHVQSRVAFAVQKKQDETWLWGSAMAQITQENGGQAQITLEPYRIRGEGKTYELRLAGWETVREAPRPASKLAFWYQAFRAVTLPLSALPVFIGASAGFAHGSFNWLLFFLTLIGTIMMHAGANAVADYFDFKKGVDRSTALSSHLGALARERVEPESILLAGFLCFALAVLIGLALIQLVSWVLVLFGLAGLLGSFFYTGRPFSYKYRGLGELMLGILLGPIVVMGSYYVQVLSWSWSIFLFSIALGMLVSSVTLANNLRDLPDDKAAGITTLPMALGIQLSKKLYYLLCSLPYLLVGAAIGLNFKFWPAALVVISLPWAFRTIQALRETADEQGSIRRKSLKSPFPLNSIKLHLRFGLCLLAGIVIAGLIRLF
jgi:1,4-dihydroxy-2-naphthoate octaprenyltransferase